MGDIEVDFSKCPFGNTVKEQLRTLPELLAKDRNILLSKMQNITNHSDFKDEENERAISSAMRDMEKRHIDTSSRIDKVEKSVQEVKSEITEVKEMSYANSRVLRQLTDIGKWALRVFTAILIALLIAGVKIFLGI